MLVSSVIEMVMDVPPLTLSQDTQVELYFSPKGGAEAAVIAAINNANEGVYVLAYSFTSKPIVNALIAATQRGVQVEVIVDKSQVKGKGSMGSEMVAHAPVYVDRQHAIAHNKVIVIDWKTVVTGSFNFTANAEHRNAENLIIIHSPKLADFYFTEWLKHKGHSEDWPTPLQLE